jgi:pyruvate kinase
VLSLNVDFVALSFVRKASDVHLLLGLIKKAGSNAKVISKLERPEAVEGNNLDEIIEASYAIMVARGDMGVEMGPEAVPALQKRIIAKCVASCTPVITATQMLESMISNPRPTRAEASDVANAIYDRTSAVMLSGETAAGLFPIESVKIMSRIIETTEADLFKSWDHTPVWRAASGSVSVPRATIHAAARGAVEAGAKLIAVFTESGFTARYISAERLPIPVIGFTPNDFTVQRMTVQFGIIAHKVKAARTSLAQTIEGEKILLAQGLAKKGDRIVMVFGSSREPGFTNIVNIRILGDAQ